jgi:polysaccharide export outer membrane protein
LRKYFFRISSVFFAASLVSCASYKQNIMFKTDGANLQQQATDAERNYVIQKNDFLKLAVYTGKGERIIDPDLELLKEAVAQNNAIRPDPNYLVNASGMAKFPKIGEIKIEGLTLRKAEELLQNEYEKFYTDVFVTLTFTNKRVIVLGAPKGKVIPLLNENMSLIEVLALAEAIDNSAKVNNIRVLRGTEVFVADLSTVQGYQKSNMIMQNGDVVYVEPVRRPAAEATRDYGPILNLGISITTLIITLVLIGQ